MKRIIVSVFVLISIAQIGNALPNIGQKKNLQKTAAGCSPTTAVIDLDVNNVRARLMNGGDMWWDIPNSNASYEVPKGSNKNALFAGSIWIGGYDKGSGQLKVAAQTYRQSGNDYWSGPLDGNGSVNFQVCSEWDRFWKVSASDVSFFRSIYEKYDQSQWTNQIQQLEAQIADVIKQWPAKGNPDVVGAGGDKLDVLKEMAEYVDVDGQPGYQWRNGDYPKIVGDQYIWWVFNDVGSAKTETGSDAIGLEIHAAAFAFATNNCLNDATFYNYKVNNFSTSELDSTYMATWCDADLGYAFDDYVGCDTSRGLGILYNGDGYDNGSQGYGFEIPMVGVDYFQGPKYKVNGKDSELKMTVFTYYNNTGGPTGNPSALDDFYGFITGTWKDGAAFLDACDPRNGPGPNTKFIFTGDPCRGGGWSEAACNSQPNDRRFIHSSGPFPLIPGAEPNNITIGAIWVPNVGGGKAACFAKIQTCDDIAQDLFISKFKLPFGPNAPATNVTSLDKKLVFDLSNAEYSNNYAEGYGTNMDPTKSKMREVIEKAKTIGSTDTLYRFEGYIVYQLKNSSVSLADIRSTDGSVNTDVARIAFQCDKKNNVTRCFNYEPNPDIDPNFYIPKKMVEGSDKGIQHSFQLTSDLFATGTSKSLVNYKTYYYLAVAYAYNNFRQFDPNKTDSTQKFQYLESRTDGFEQPIQIIQAMPHPASDSLYIQTYADYGTGIELKRIEGKGNGGVALQMTEASEMEALTGPNYQSYFPVYKGNHGPMTLKVVNPDSIKAGQYEVRFKVDSFYSSGSDTSRGIKAPYGKWMIIKKNAGSLNDTIWSEVTLADTNELYLRKYNMFDWGLAANASQVSRPGDRPTAVDPAANGKLWDTLMYDDQTKPWLSGLPDADGKSFLNWIRAGAEFSANQDPQYNNCSMIDWDNGFDSQLGVPVIGNKDQLNHFETILGGTWSPYNLSSNEISYDCGYGVMYGSGSRTVNRLEDVSSIDVVFTPDRSLWSRCPVVEMSDRATNGLLSEGLMNKFNLRAHNGWNGGYDEIGYPTYSDDVNDYGMSYFPGYAINMETGERLNIFFGECSSNSADNGKDMIWNPTSTILEFNNFQYRFGGKHVIYVTKQKYDGGAFLRGKLLEAGNQQSSSALQSVYLQVQWVGYPLLAPNQSFASLKNGLIPTRTRVSIRVTRPYNWYLPEPGQTAQNDGWPLYTFNTNDLAPVSIGDSRNSFTGNKDEIFKRIQPVPNPYYAVSEYEVNNLDNRIRIINLPEKANLKIYTLDGILVRNLDKNDIKTNYIDWDLKNSKNIPISSGMYLIHVTLPGIGETTLKWFGAMRPTDITSF